LKGGGGGTKKKKGPRAKGGKKKKLHHAGRALSLGGDEKIHSSDGLGPGGPPAGVSRSIFFAMETGDLSRRFWPPIGLPGEGGPPKGGPQVKVSRKGGRGPGEILWVTPAGGPGG